MELLVETLACPLCGGCAELCCNLTPLFGEPVCRKCYFGFSSRRYLAFVIDYFLLWPASSIAWLVLRFPLAVLSSLLRTNLLYAEWAVVLLTFLFKDGFRGYSVGRALLGLRVLNATSGRPSGFSASFKRNLPLLIPFAAFFAALQLRKGTRTGDVWAGTRVIWKKYEQALPFRVGVPSTF
jgi:uncharacterized RDD family membrane protein YckC